MCSKYPLYLYGEKIGTITVEKKELYYQFTCKCHLPDAKLYEVMVINGNLTRKLCLCIPNADEFGFTTSMPVKRFTSDSFAFIALPKNTAVDQVVPVNTDMVFPWLSKLKSAHFSIKDHQSYIMLQFDSCCQNTENSHY